MTFNQDNLRNVDFNRAAKEQYGWEWGAVNTSSHMYGWAARKSGEQDRGIDLLRAAKSQVGPNAVPITLGSSANDWRFIDFSQVQFKVIPIVLGAQALHFDVPKITEAINNLKSHLIAGQEWTRQLVGKTYDLLPPVFYPTDLNKGQIDEWNHFMAQTVVNQQGQTERHPKAFDYFYGIQNKVKECLGINFNPVTHKYVVFVHGLDQQGSSAISPTAVVHSAVFNNSYKQFEAIAYSNPTTDKGSKADNIYAHVHELLHTFGLNHSNTAFPDKDTSRTIMTTARPPVGILIPEEINLLRNNPFFK